MSTRARPFYVAEYVGTVTADGSGEPVQVSGAAKLQIVVGDYRPTVVTVPRVGDPVLTASQLNRVRIVTDARYAGFFEGQSTFGFGLSDHRRPFRVGMAGSTLYVDFATTR
jgi:hypothetical protein